MDPVGGVDWGRVIDERDRLMSSVNASELCSGISTVVAVSPAVRAEIDAYFDEVDVGLQVVREAVERWVAAGGEEAPRIVEVGSGLGLVQRILAAAGLDVCGVEPAGLGFEVISACLEELARRLGPCPAVTARCAVEDVAVGELGTFDVVCSTYVLEHVPDLPSVVSAIAALMAPGCVGVHLAPNYTVPYDPHFGVPTFRWGRGLLTRTFAERFAERPGLWESVNFVTARQLEQISRRHGLACTFVPGVMAQTFDRLTGEPQFAKRHPRLSGVAGFASRMGVRSLLQRWPALLSTPMMVVMTRSSGMD